MTEAAMVSTVFSPVIILERIKLTPSGPFSPQKRDTTLNKFLYSNSQFKKKKKVYPKLLIEVSAVGAKAWAMGTERPGLMTRINHLLTSYVTLDKS